jgi:hypothetical protein
MSWHRLRLFRRERQLALAPAVRRIGCRPEEEPNLSWIFGVRLNSIFEAPNSFGQALPKLRQLLRAEQKQCNYQDHQQVPRLE